MGGVFTHRIAYELSLLGTNKVENYDCTFSCFIPCIIMYGYWQREVMKERRKSVGSHDGW
jgi:hypothetical protein